MQTVIGLGKVGCNIADLLSQYPQYQIKKIDVGLKKTKTTFGLKHQDGPELYEKANLPKGINNFLEGVMSETLFITSCGAVSGASLKILQKIHGKTKIRVLYIIPQKDDLVGEKLLQNNLLFNVFQEYARSNLLDRVFLVDNSKLSDIIGPVPLMKFWDSMNNLVATTYHMINVFQNTQAIMTTQTKRINTARVSTFGLLNSEKNEEKMFFGLDIPREKCYYYGVPKKQLEEDPNLMEVIKTNLKSNIEHNKIKITYSVHSTDYDKIISYCEKSSTLIQQLAV
jgi:hypothetical protein|tara:strand:- start:24 stop:872 length:849 start_codon:yes stop_codon:yes gene_type:complete